MKKTVMVDGKRCKVDALPSVVQGNLDLIGCDVRSLPDGLTVGGHLFLDGCTGLTALPDGLTVGGSLSISDCTGLTALPDGLTVGGSLFLSGCTGLSGVEIPAGVVKCSVYR